VQKKVGYGLEHAYSENANSLKIFYFGLWILAWAEFDTIIPHNSPIFKLFSIFHLVIAFSLHFSSALQFSVYV